MKIVIPAMEVDPSENPDMAGEYLRGYFFDQSKGYGCYSTFDLNDGVEELGQIPIGGEWSEGIFWHQFQRGEFFMRYYWDGDGVLEFRLPDGTWLYNGDCKKDYNWHHLEDYSELEHEA